MKINRRKFLGQAASVAGGAMLAGGRVFAGESSPNVLLVLVDQMRQPRWFPKDAHLPNLGRLRSRGMEFTNHFVSAVACSPSRACLMTGLHMYAHGVRNNIYGDIQPSLDPGITTLGHVFRNAGYLTPYFGKWHLTRSDDYQAFGGLEPYGFDCKRLPKKPALFPGLQNDGGFTREACNWLHTHTGNDRPWFMTLSLINPHDICSYPKLDIPPLLIRDVVDRLPDNWDDDLSGKPRCQAEYQIAYGIMAGEMNLNNEKVWRQYLDYYYFLNRKIDTLLGKVLDTLDATGQADNTIVIFTSDHGDMGGSHRLRSKGPCVYRENMNVPLVVSWPGRIPAGAQTDALSQNIDILPTLARVLGIDVDAKFQGLPGRDLGPLMTGRVTGDLTDHVLFSFTSNTYVETSVKKKGFPGVPSPHNIRAIRERRWVYARYFDPAIENEEYELYDTLNDSLEMKNLAGDPGYKNRKKEMADKLREAQENEMRSNPATNEFK